MGTIILKPTVFVADLTHTAQGISALTFPLGASYIVSYAQSVFDDELDFRLFKFPEPMAEAILAEKPRVLAFSNYSWNLEIAYELAR